MRYRKEIKTMLESQDDVVLNRSLPHFCETDLVDIDERYKRIYYKYKNNIQFQKDVKENDKILAAQLEAKKKEEDLLFKNKEAAPEGEAER